MFDDNNSNELDINEFRIMIKTISQQFKDEKIEPFFHLFDKSDDGKINFDEFKIILE